jgi:hypothetical protein
VEDVLAVALLLPLLLHVDAEDASSRGLEEVCGAAVATDFCSRGNARSMLLPKEVNEEISSGSGMEHVAVAMSTAAAAEASSTGGNNPGSA